MKQEKSKVLDLTPYFGDFERCSNPVDVPEIKLVVAIIELPEV